MGSKKQYRINQRQLGHMRNYTCTTTSRRHHNAKKKMKEKERLWMSMRSPNMTRITVWTTLREDFQSLTNKYRWRATYSSIQVIIGEIWRDRTTNRRPCLQRHRKKTSSQAKITWSGQPWVPKTNQISTRRTTSVKKRFQTQWSTHITSQTNSSHATHSLILTQETETRSPMPTRTHNWSPMKVERGTQEAKAPPSTSSSCQSNRVWMPRAEGTWLVCRPICKRFKMRWWPDSKPEMIMKQTVLSTSRP